jgi:hypothetical protein
MDELRADRFSMLDVGEAPEVPGIYAWYANFRAGVQDWRFKPTEFGDGAISPFAELMRRYALQFEPLAIELAGSGSYGAKWSGSLGLNYPFRVESSEPSTSGPEPEPEPAMRTAVENETNRKVMATILERVTPVFSAPLYIGVTDNLRVRLRDHRRSYSKAFEWLKNHPEDFPKVREKGKSFGERAAAREIAMENLEAWVICLDEEIAGVPLKTLREIFESAEWFTHRVYSPILGRR